MSFSSNIARMWEFITYRFANGPDGTGVDAVDTLQGENTAEERCDHDKDTATQENSDNQLSMRCLVRTGSLRLHFNILTDAMRVAL